MPNIKAKNVNIHLDIKNININNRNLTEYQQVNFFLMKVIEELKSKLRSKNIVFSEIHNKPDYNLEFTILKKTYILKIETYSSRIKYFTIFTNDDKLLELNNNDSNIINLDSFDNLILTQIADLINNV
jgi:hypothetical protein